jgi:hypothetical protein
MMESFALIVIFALAYLILWGIIESIYVDSILWWRRWLRSKQKDNRDE